jgi:hypothetical protein
MSTVLRYAWAAPATLVGVLVALPAFATGARARVIVGVIEITGGGVGRLIAALPLRYRFCAITFGHVVVCTDQWTAAAVRAHEHVHVHQYERLGALFFPLYIGSSVAQLLRGRDPYFDNRFEREACALADR